MHKLIRLVVPPEDLYSDETQTFADLDAGAQRAVVDEAQARARSHIERAIAKQNGGFADWWEEHAGRWSFAKNVEYGDRNLAWLLEDDHAYEPFDGDEYGHEDGLKDRGEAPYVPDEVVLAGDDARAELDQAWDETREALNRDLRKAREDLEEAGIDPAEFFEQDVEAIRGVDDGMVQHYLDGAFCYGPQPNCYGYITAPWWSSILDEGQYEQASEFVDDGGLLVCIDVHY